MSQPRPFGRKNRPAGFTALEVVVATALASLMMVAVLGVLGGISRKERLLADLAETAPAWQRQFLQQIERDLESSSTLKVDGSAIVLTGFGGRRDGMPTWEPVEIHYWTDQASDQSILMRQVLPLVQPSEPYHPEIVCLGVDEISLNPETDNPDILRADTQSTGDAVLPHRVRVQLLNRGRIIFDRLVSIN